MAPKNVRRGYITLPGDVRRWEKGQFGGRRGAPARNVSRRASKSGKPMVRRTTQEVGKHIEPRRFPGTAQLRGMLAQYITWLVIVLSLAAVVVPDALPVLEKLLQVLMLVLGFYFAQQVGRSRK